MAKHKVTVEVEFPDVMMATMAGQGIQNILDALGEHQNYLIELADPQVANHYKTKLMGVLNNKAFQAIISKF